MSGGVAMDEVKIRNERDLITWYWNEHGGNEHDGTLIIEFRAVTQTPHQGRRDIDAVVVEDGKRRWLANGDYDSANIAGKDIVVIQAKRGRLGMSVLGQALFSKELMRPFRPSNIRTIALCEDTDTVLEPLAKKYGIEVVYRT